MTLLGSVMMDPLCCSTNMCWLVLLPGRDHRAPPAEPSEAAEEAWFPCGAALPGDGMVLAPLTAAFALMGLLAPLVLLVLLMMLLVLLLRRCRGWLGRLWVRLLMRDRRRVLSARSCRASYKGEQNIQGQLKLSTLHSYWLTSTAWITPVDHTRGSTPIAILNACRCR